MFGNSPTNGLQPALNLSVIPACMIDWKTSQMRKKIHVTGYLTQSPLKNGLSQAMLRTRMEFCGLKENLELESQQL